MVDVQRLLLLIPISHSVHNEILSQILAAAGSLGRRDFVGSTDLLSAQHTSRFIVPFLVAELHISWAAINTIHRNPKTGAHQRMRDSGSSVARTASHCAHQNADFVWRSFLRVQFCRHREFHQSFVGRDPQIARPVG